MAAPDRTQAHDLIDWSAEIAGLQRSGLFAVLRRAEAKDSGKPRIGAARRPEQSIVDLAQEPSLAFSPRTLAKLEFRHGRPRLYGEWLGLLGPMGPLPIHLTEFAAYERRYAEKQPFLDWLNTISGRMLQLFYRAWAESQPAAQADRPADDRFADWLGALSGAGEGAGPNNRFNARARLHYAAVFAGPRSAVAIEDALSHLLRQPAQVVEFVPRWRDLEREDRTRLGRNYATLGQDAVLGGRIYSASDAFRVIVRAQNHADYLSLMPGGTRFAVAAEAIEAFKPTHLEWDLCVELADDDAPPARLDGKTRLGWTGWLKPRGSAIAAIARRRRKPGSATGSELVAHSQSTGPIRADAHLRKTSLRKRKPSA
ncbi:type VI secretion system baseplate subunit TssG [Novosphingobium sp. ERN07]|uniref:type VI secretion system baseplate subunit TssG n=1 Tax=Novosphingobium sp. ERN07 TaxID=2726187 RepID=UPI0014572735|nr:type VI secretion system baseplate subunit TssG [Novosphingobium sp. ERN07]NLR72742.1 type VI secretion system baseplate subunit TssG [Novosphingobium sp. ERN07]